MTFTTDILPPLSLTAIVVGLALIALGFLVVRLLIGPSAALAKRTGLIAIRGCVVVLLLLLLINPVKVMESAGKLQRGEVFYLLDTSASMNIGGERTRWNDVLSFIDSAQQNAAGPTVAEVKQFRFGHRLSSLEESQAQQARITSTASNAITPVNFDSALGLTPTDTDTRLQLALQQVISRFSHAPPGAVVLFSDGRTRDAEGMEDIARHFAKLKVPIHVMPAGDTKQAGDIALIAVVVPTTVRKETEVEVQVFLRSYGYEGRRVEVQLLAPDDAGLLTRPLAPPQPVVLQGGVQSVSLRFRADSQTSEFVVTIPAQADEITSRNNEMRAEIDIDRTKIRVLYIEGSREPPRVTRRGEELVNRGPYSELSDALTADPDIECVVLNTLYGDIRRLKGDGTLGSVRGFPATQAELLAYDAIILSNVQRQLFTEEQLGWLETWIGQRGGGLCMAGGPQSFASGDWNQGPLQRMLPVTMTAGSDWDPAAEVVATVAEDQRGHPLWRLVSEVSENEKLLKTFPPFEGLNRGLAPKPAFAEVLASAQLSPTAANSTGGVFNLGFGNFQLPKIDNKNAEENAAEKSGEGETIELPVVTVGRFGKGRTMAMSTAITTPWANAFINDWGSGDNRYYAKYWRNAVYWLTENSSIGRRRLLADYDRRYYQPGDSILLRAQAYDESAELTQKYRLVAMIEPQSLDFDFESIYSPIRWPVGIPRESGEEGPYIAWGEEFPLPQLTAQTAGPLGANAEGYGIELQIADMLSGDSTEEGLRIELTAYEGYTQVDSSSLEVHVLQDPFEQKNPFPDHELLARIAELSGGTVLESPAELTKILESQPVTVGTPEVRKMPIWSNWWVWSLVVVLLSVEWFWRRNLGLA